MKAEKEQRERLQKIINGDIQEMNISFSYENKKLQEKYWWISIPIAIASIVVSVISILLKTGVL